MNGKIRQGKMIAKFVLMLVTGFVVPNDFVQLYSWGDTVVRHHGHHGSDGTCEVLVCHESQVGLFNINGI
jgi:hypothetical protein